MGTLHLLCSLLLVIFSSSLPSLEAVRGRSVLVNEKGRKLATNVKLAAVNLGGWLVIEQWIRPSIWDGIPENDLLDGSQIQLKSTTLQTYVCAENGGGEEVVVNRTKASGWETFKIWRYSNDTYNLRVFNNQFITALNDGSGNVKATASEPPGEWARFTFTRNGNKVHIKAYNGMYLQAKNVNHLTADYLSSSEPGWDDNSATFDMIITDPSPYHGDYQLANGWGPDKAPEVYQKHRDTFVTEDDFQYLTSIGINAVRIPVGYWIAYDNNPPKPFVSGSKEALDNAFDWAEKHNIKIIIDLHAAPGSQNGQEHSATRDGVSEWATGKDENGETYINLTLSAIEFLASSYGNRNGLYGIELLNEPQANDVPLDTLKNYYRQGYEIVRKYSADAAVFFSPRLGSSASADGLLDLGSQFSNVIIDLHYYNVFGEPFIDFDVEQNIEYIKNERRQEIESLNQNGNGVRTFIGEWANEWAYRGASKSEYQMFGETQLQVYGEATAGWAYWNYIIDRSDYVNWDFRRSYEQGYILEPENGWNP